MIRDGSEPASAADGLAGAGWGRARDHVFERAIGNAQGHFSRCARCSHSVYARCWTAAHGLCLVCAPDTAAESTAARQHGLTAAFGPAAAPAGRL
ncbi:hypothetical protein ACF1B0_30115 [Streptomyces anandii]|uniref:hypothetical protein n=1 Tax=Streptomyces anandii TaxID=285454 RepID=UPI0037033BF3